MQCSTAFNSSSEIYHFRVFIDFYFLPLCWYWNSACTIVHTSWRCSEWTFLPYSMVRSPNWCRHASDSTWSSIRHRRPAHAAGMTMWCRISGSISTRTIPREMQWSSPRAMVMTTTTAECWMCVGRAIGVGKIGRCPRRRCRRWRKSANQWCLLVISLMFL